MAKHVPVSDPLSSFRLDRDGAVATGGSSGIGRAVASAFAAVGTRVAICDLAASAPDAYKVDAADEAQVRAAFAEVVSRHGRLDVLFNNAGIALRPAHDRAQPGRLEQGGRARAGDRRCLPRALTS